MKYEEYVKYRDENLILDQIRLSSPLHPINAYGNSILHLSH
jgi:hypothetical protein